MEPGSNVQNNFINYVRGGDSEQFCEGKQNVLHDRDEDLCFEV